MFWWVVTPILTFYLKMSTGVPIDRISHELTYLGETLRITPCMPTAIAPAEKKTSVLRFREQICQN